MFNSSPDSCLKIGFSVEFQGMEIFTKTFLLFLVLLNPFTMIIYLLEVIKTFEFFSLFQATPFGAIHKLLLPSLVLPWRGRPSLNRFFRFASPSFKFLEVFPFSLLVFDSSLEWSHRWRPSEQIPHNCLERLPCL